jgi:hypothetical protein
MQIKWAEINTIEQNKRTILISVPPGDVLMDLTPMDQEDAKQARERLRTTLKTCFEAVTGSVCVIIIDGDWPGK